MTRITRALAAGTVDSPMMDFSISPQRRLNSLPTRDGGPLAAIFPGTEGDDIVHGTAGNDVIHGLGGRDTLYGENGDDQLYGDAGDDFLFGGWGDDTLDGGSGNDQLGWNDNGQQSDTSPGVDRYYGRDGDDTIMIGNRHLADGGAGRDRLFLELRLSPLAVNSDLTAMPTAWVQIAGSSATGFEWVDGYLSAHDDRLIGGDALLTISGMAGNDWIEGGREDDRLRGDAGDDELIGGGGNDWLSGYSGSDTLRGGEGDDALSPDAYYADATFTPPVWANDLAYGGAGADSVQYRGPRADFEITRIGSYYLVKHLPSGTEDRLYSIERVTFTDTAVDLTPILFSEDDDVLDFDDIDPADFAASYAANEHLNAQGGDDVVRFPTTVSGYTTHKLTGATFDAGAGDDIVWGGQLSDRLDGNADRDTLYGEGGNDELLGGEGDDVLDGGVGSDTLNGGAGSDTASYATSSAAVEVDLANGSASGSVSGSDVLISIENAIGTALADELTGSSGANRLEGGGGADRILGGTGADTLIGGAGDDLLVGGSVAAADTDVDRLQGGGEADRYLVDSNDIVMGLSANDIGVLYRGQNAGRLVVIGEGTDREVRSYGSGFAAYEAFTIEAAQAGQRLVAEAGVMEGAAGAFLTFAGNPVGAVLDRVAFDPALTRTALGSRLDSFHETIDTLFGGGSSSAQAVVSEDPLHVTGTELAALTAVGIALALKYYIVREAKKAIEQDWQVDALALTTEGVGPASVTASISDLFGVVQDFRLTADQVIRQSILPTAFRNDARTVEGVSAMFDNGTGLEPATAGHLVLSAALDFQLTYIEQTAVTVVDRFLSAIGGGGSQPGSAAAPTLAAPAAGGDDIIVARVSQALYAALAGDDFIVGDGFERETGQTAAKGVHHTFDGGAGVDTLSYGYDRDGVTVDLAAGSAQGVFIGADTLISIEHASGGAGADTIRGSGVANELFGAGGDDLLDGRSGADVLDGGDGNDRLFGGMGNDLLRGGSGQDVLAGGAGSDTAVFEGSVRDYRLFQDGASYRLKGPDGSDIITDVEALRFDDATIDLTLIICDPNFGQPSSGDVGGVDLLSNWNDAQHRPTSPNPFPPDHESPVVLPRPDDLFLLKTKGFEGPEVLPCEGFEKSLLLTDRMAAAYHWTHQLAVDEQGLVQTHGVAGGWGTDAWL